MQSPTELLYYNDPIGPTLNTPIGTETMQAYPPETAQRDADLDMAATAKQANLPGGSSPAARTWLNRWSVMMLVAAVGLLLSWAGTRL